MPRRIGVGKRSIEKEARRLRVLMGGTTTTTGTHNILSSRHNDADPDPVTDGDMIIGNVTPKWSALAISVPAANVHNYLGVDNGELRPSWKSGSSNPGAASGILASDASGYVQLTGLGITAAPASNDLHIGTGQGITHADGVADGNVLRANGTRYIPATLDVDDITDLAYAAPNFTLTTANAIGAANTVVRSDASILVFDAVVPTTISPDDAAAAGAAAVAARRDHTHAISCAAPSTNLSVSSTNQEGVYTDFARADHEHDIDTSDSPGAAASILASSAAGKLTLVDLALSSLTASTVIYSDASKEIESLANAAGFLKNDGVGGLSWDAVGLTHNLMSATHTDTSAGAVVDGDIIIGNVTPEWEALAISVPAAGTVNYLGVNNAELRPSWKSASNNPGAAAAVLASTSAGALTLVDLTLSSLTASTVIYSDAAKKIVSLANAAGYLTNNGAGALSWSAGATPSAHNLLSASHGDTLADAATDGDIIIGNVTPAWSALAISVPAANVRNVLGVDNGELRPSWKAALDGNNPATLTVSTVAAAGTSLVFSHRDHEHDITSSSNPGAAASILASSAAGALTLVDLTLSSLTASTVIYSDAAKKIVSLANAAGYLTNNGAGALSWSSTATATAHNLLSLSHGDALVDAVTDGDIIIGNNTPAWSSLAISVPAAGTLNYLGVNNAELRPSWKSASSNPGGNALVLQSNTSGYLQLERLGAGVAPSFPLHALSASGAQMRLDYDATHTCSFMVDAFGDLNISTTSNITYLEDLDANAGGSSVYLDGSAGAVEYTGNLVSVKAANHNVYGFYEFDPPLEADNGTGFDGTYDFSDVSSSTGVADDEWELSGNPTAIPVGVQAVLVSVQARDSGSAGTAGLYVALYPNNTTSYWQLVCDLSGKANDDWHYVTGIVGVDANRDIWYRINASGTGTLNAIMKIHGYFI